MRLRDYRVQQLITGYHNMKLTLSFARCSIVIGEATAANISEGRLSLLLFLSASRLG